MKQAWKKYLLYGSAAVGAAILAYILIETVRLRNTGFEIKTLWDWMELLIIPAFLAGGAYYLQRSEKAVERKAAEDRAKVERELATDRQQEAALQAYLDRMAELLLEKKPGESEEERVLKVKRVRTLTVMRVLNAARNGIVLRFLRDIGLVGNQESNFFVKANLQGADLQDADFSDTNLQIARLPYANLRGANLFNANLQVANLQSTNLRGASLSRANLQGAGLEGADMEDAALREANLHRGRMDYTNLRYAQLSKANLQDASLSGSNLQFANLEYANLKGALVSNEQLAAAKSLKGAIMPDGTIHD